MKEKKVLFSIQVLEDGSLKPVNSEGKELAELDAKGLGETLIGKEIKRAAILPSITYLTSNPGWVCILGNWYYM